MILKQISQCAKNLDFKPIATWPSALPAVAVCAELISGFNLADSHPVIDWEKPQGQSTWASSIKSIYPDLSLPEIARLKKSLKNFDISWPSMLAQYNLRPSENLDRILDIIIQLPMPLQNWLSDKKMSVQDLMIFTAAPIEIISECLNFVSQNGFSKSQAVSTIEYLCELKLSGQVDQFDSFIDTNSDEIFKKIYAKRHSQTVERDQAREKKLNLPWPQNIKPQISRRGDRSGFEFKIFVASPLELKKYLIGLEKVVQEWKE